jgi:hypothetical protein
MEHWGDGLTLARNWMWGMKMKIVHWVRVSDICAVVAVLHYSGRDSRNPKMHLNRNILQLVDLPDCEPG